MSETADSSLHTEVPAASEADVQSGKELREDLIATAVKFLQNPKVRQSPFAQRKAFLERKGLTKSEIDLAVYRSGTSGDEQAVVSTNPPSYNNVSTAPPVISSVAENTIAPSGWERIRSTTSVAVVVGATAYLAYQLYNKYLAPALWGKKTSDDVCNSMDQLQRSVEELTAGMKETQQLLRNQQRSLDDIIRSTSLQRGPEEMGRLNMTDVKDEIKSLKALLLNRNQFPALPTTTPVIPSWQLQQLQLENTPKSSESAKSLDTKAESDKDQPTEKQSDAESANSDIPLTSVSLTDGDGADDDADETATVRNVEESLDSGLSDEAIVSSVAVH